MTKLDDVKPIARGEYDLVNISLLGYDPNTGRSYEECHAEFEVWRKELEERVAKRRWWQVIQYFRNNYTASILVERLGMQGFGV
jgi:hypothetical protein